MQKRETDMSSDPSAIEAQISGTTDGGLRVRKLQKERPAPESVRWYLSEQNPARVTGRSWNAHQAEDAPAVPMPPTVSLEDGQLR